MPKLGGIYVSVRARTEKYRRDLANAKTLTKKAAVVMQHQISKISFAQVAASAALAGAAIAKMSLDGFRAMEKMKISVASMASTITSFAKDADKDLAGTYLQALGYSEQLVLKMEELNAKTVATGENLTAMVETMAQGGVLLDINNKKQLDGFLAIANALALLTQGQNQDIQFRQEIRGLINGEVKATNALSRILSQKVGGNLKEHVKLWKEQGTLIESAGALLSGFQEGAKDLENTWEAVGTTLSTMYSKTLRGLMAPVYEDIIRMGKQITLNVLDQNSALNKNAVLLRTVVFKGWEDIKNITESVVDVIAAFELPLIVVGKITSMILDGWGQIFAILPAITNRLKLIVQSMGDILKISFHLGEAFRNASDFNFKEAAKSWEKAKGDWFESGKKVGEAFSGGLLEEIEGRINTFNKDLTVDPKLKTVPPELKPPAGGKTKPGKELDISGLFIPIGKDEFQRDQEMFALLEEQYEKRLELQKQFDAEYAELGMTKFDIERAQVERMAEIYREAGVEENRIAQLTADKNKQIAMAEQQAKLSIYQSAAGGIAETFQMIAQAGGKQSLAAFRAYQAFAAVEAGIAGAKAVNLALADTTIPSTVGRNIMAGLAGAKAAVQVGLILGAQPPSYDVGGVSNARGVYQTGNIREAHVPIPSGKIPVEINGGQDQQRMQEINIVNVADESKLDRYLASSRGQNAIINSVGNNRRFKRMVTQ